MGKAAKVRRGALGLPQTALVRPGLSIDTIRGIERGEPDKNAFRPNTLATMSVALRWSPGTLSSIAIGGEIPDDGNLDLETRLDAVENDLRSLREDQAEFRRLLEQLVRFGAAGLEAAEGSRP
jgi:hypothetical protein